MIGFRSRRCVRTRKGRFHYRYRFRNSTPGTIYRFRATLHSQANYPFATGSSPVVTVRIR